MKRREFLKLSSFISAGTALGALPPMVYAQTQGYNGPFILTIEASGAWDPTSFCDPKGRDNGSDEPLNNYNASQIGRSGNIRYAPAPDFHAETTDLYSAKQFYDSHRDRLLVINGIDMKTNAHFAGQKASWTGNQTDGYPNIGALVAQVKASNYVMPYLTFGGTDATGDIISPSRVEGNGINAVREIAYKDARNAYRPNDTYFEGNIKSLIDQAHADRNSRLKDTSRFIKWRESMDRFIDTSAPSTQTLRDFVANVDQEGERGLASFNGRRDAHRIYRNGRSALAAFETGAAISAHLVLGGFDTHDNHDERHYPKLMDYMQSVDAIIADANARGLGDRLVILMQSDFGRTNKYNADLGKDHWPITSAMYWGASRYFEGNRVIGSTDANHRAISVDPQTLASNSNGVRIEPQDIHRSMRRMFDVESSSTAADFAIPGRDMPIFG